MPFVLNYTIKLKNCCKGIFLKFACSCIFHTFQWLYRLAVEEVPEDDYMLPLSEAEVCHFFVILIILISAKITHLVDPQVIREGCDITLVGWGAQLSVMEQACIDAEKVILWHGHLIMMMFRIDCYLSNVLKLSRC